MGNQAKVLQMGMIKIIMLTKQRKKIINGTFHRRAWTTVRKKKSIILRRQEIEGEAAYNTVLSTK